MEIIATKIFKEKQAISTRQWAIKIGNLEAVHSSRLIA